MLPVAAQRPRWPSAMNNPRESSGVIRLRRIFLSTGQRYQRICSVLLTSRIGASRISLFLFERGLIELTLYDLRHEAITREFERGTRIPEVMAINEHQAASQLFKYVQASRVIKHDESNIQLRIIYQCQNEQMLKVTAKRR